MKRTSKTSVGPYGPDNPDPAPDCYSVTREPDRYVVKHFPTLTSKKPCCVVSVARKDGEDEVEALEKTYRRCEAKHAQQERQAS